MYFSRDVYIHLFFSADCAPVNLFWQWLCRRISFGKSMLAEYCFQNHPPPTFKVKYSTPYTMKLTSAAEPDEDPRAILV